MIFLIKKLEQFQEQYFLSNTIIQLTPAQGLSWLFHD